MTRTWPARHVELLIMWWRAGVSIRSMAYCLTRSPKAVVAMAARLRERGEDLPFRNPEARRRG